MNNYAHLDLWFDTRTLDEKADREKIKGRVCESEYNGVIVSYENISDYIAWVKPGMSLIIAVNDASDAYELQADSACDVSQAARVIFLSDQLELLSCIKSQACLTCYQTSAHNEARLIEAIEESRVHDYLLIGFPDPTNIPLELVIAKLQNKTTRVVKSIADDADYEDAQVVFGVMEVGADGIAFSPKDVADLSRMSDFFKSAEHDKLTIQSGRIVTNKPIGMGYRSCIDLVTLFEADEGMLVGSTSQGGVFCCPEVFYLPYMELRPFRVNAGGIHSYVYNTNDTTHYMSELKAGMPMMVVNHRGEVRTAAIGRVKTEIRPLRMLEVEFEQGERVNIIMQDDWHVRIFYADGSPANITELQIGDAVLGYVAQPGRHVGVKVDEHIIEC